MRIWHSNIALAGQYLEVSSSSSSAGYIPSNALHPHRALPWKTGTSTAAEHLEIDFGTAKTVGGIVIVGHDLVGGDTVSILANTSSSWGSPAFSQSLTVGTEISHKFSSAQTFRYWRLAITKASAGVSRSVGVVMLSSVYDTPVQPDYDGFREQLIDPSNTTRTPSGQVYSEILPKFTEHEVRFSFAEQSFKDSIDAIHRAVGTTGQVAFQVETSGALTKVWYSRFKDFSPWAVSGFDSSLRYNFELTFEELL